MKTVLLDIGLQGLGTWKERRMEVRTYQARNAQCTVRSVAPSTITETVAVSEWKSSDFARQTLEVHATPQAAGLPQGPPRHTWCEGSQIWRGRHRERYGKVVGPLLDTTGGKAVLELKRGHWSYDTKITPNLIDTAQQQIPSQYLQSQLEHPRYAGHQQLPAYPEGVRAAEALPQKCLERSTCPWSVVTCPEARER